MGPAVDEKTLTAFVDADAEAQVGIVADWAWIEVEAENHRLTTATGSQTINSRVAHTKVSTWWSPR